MSKQLKDLAEKDERSLRAYCRRVLQLHVDETYIKEDIQNNSNINIQTNKKKVGALKQK